MNKTISGSVTMTAAFAVVLSIFATGQSLAQQSKSGKIICWKDSSGKVVGCGDRVPPEYQQSATKELDKQGVTRGTTLTAAEETKRREQGEELARKKAEEERLIAEQKRQDTALLSTYVSEKEIDQRRDRDLQQADAQISQLQNSLKIATTQHDEARKRHDAAAKSGKPVADTLKHELTRANADKQKYESNLAAKEQEKVSISERYAVQKKRFLELKGSQPAASPAPAAAAKK